MTWPTDTRFDDDLDLDITLRDASLDPGNRPTRRMIAAAAIGMEVDDAYFSTRALRRAVCSVHEGEVAGKARLAAILSDDATDDFQRCLYFCLAGRGVVAMLDDLMWLERLLEARGRLAGKFMQSGVKVRTLVDPYVAKEPDGPVGCVTPDFRQGSSWWVDQTISG